MEQFTNDDYETPDWLAKAMCSLILPADKYILEPFAGTGQIVKYLPSDSEALRRNRITDAVEIKPSRFRSLSLLPPQKRTGSLYQSNFFEMQKWDFGSEYDLIITNPPFSLCVEAIAHALTLLNLDNPDARLLFLMPLDWNCAQSRAKKWGKLDAHIHHVYRIAKRVDYLKKGIPMSQCQKIKDGVPQFDKNGKPIMNSGRQCYDAVFDIRPGKINPSTTFLY
jgi:hypothetical protein